MLMHLLCVPLHWFTSFTAEGSDVCWKYRGLSRRDGDSVSLSVQCPLRCCPRPGTLYHGLDILFGRERIVLNESLSDTSGRDDIGLIIEIR